ncbi:MAG: MarP family serine protease [Candidatus Limnocylindrales bacterium]
MNLVDVAAVLLVALAIYFGWRSGFIIQLLALVGFLGGIALMVLIAPHAAELVADMDPWLRTVVSIGVVAGIVLLAQGLGSGAGAAVKRRIGPGILTGIDHGLGAAFGLARGVFMVWLIGGLLSLLPVPNVATEARQSFVLRALDSRLPSPVVLAAELGRLIEAAGLPDIFVGAPPPIDIPVGGPNGETAEALVAAARRSTVRVESTACGLFLTGTGFAVTPDHLVTNAHVVAGSDRVWVSFDGSLDRFQATVVDFDPGLDAALLHVAGMAAAPLTLDDGLPERGQPAAALGFTGGGRQRVIPGVISRTLSALGRDIYGSSVVAREVVEMRLDVSPGDSGGPVLLTSGKVAGVTFSESRESPEIGYALSPVSVAVSINDSLRATQPVATGACLT